MAEYNIFKFLKRDTSHRLVKSNYIYQYDIYLKNLSYKRTFDTVLLCYAFLQFIYLIYRAIFIMNPAVKCYTPELMDLIEFRVPLEY